MQKFTLTNRWLSQGNNCAVKIFADGWVEVELWSQLGLTHSDDVLVPDLLFLKEPIAFVNLSIGTY